MLHEKKKLMLLYILCMKSGSNVGESKLVVGLYRSISILSTIYSCPLPPKPGFGV